MDVVEERCAGIDLSKTDAKVCVRVPGAGKRARREIRTFSTMSDGLLELRDWLLENGVTRVGMEATASYWKPFVRHEALFDRAEMEGLRRRAVAAA
jgi:transposase